MNFARRIALLLILSLLLRSALPSHAQGESFGLSGDDAALWQSAFAATVGAKQLSYRYDLQLDVDGLRKFAHGAALQGQGQIDLSGAQPKLAFDASGTLRAGSAYTTPVGIQARLIDGSLYFKGAEQADWQSMPLSSAKLTVTGGAIAATSAATLDLGPLTSAQPPLGGLELILPGVLALDYSAFMSAQRLPDADGMAQFRFALDARKLATAASFIALMREVNQTQGNFFGALNDAKWAERADTLASFFPQASLTVTADVDPAAKVIRRLVVEGANPLPDADQPLATSATPNQLHLDLTFDGVGQPQTIAIPADAKPVDALSLAFEPTIPAVASGSGPQLLMFVGVVDQDGAASVPLALKSGQTITIVARTLSPTLDFESVVTLLAPDGSTAAENDYYEGETPTLWGQDAGIDDFAVPADGTYQVQVTGYEGDPGPFLLTVYVAG